MDLYKSHVTLIAARVMTMAVAELIEDVIVSTQPRVESFSMEVSISIVTCPSSRSTHGIVRKATKISM